MGCHSEFVSPLDLSLHFSSIHLKTDLCENADTDFDTKSKSESEFKRIKTFQTFDDIFDITREDKDEVGISIDSASNSGSIKRKSDAEDGNENTMQKKIKANVEISSDIGDKAIATTLSQSAKTEYYYFCLDCESHAGDAAECDHTNHPRVPIGIDIAGHYSSTKHTNLQPIREVV